MGWPIFVPLLAIAAFLAEVKTGKGRVLHIGSYPGDAQNEKWTQSFEDLLRAADVLVYVERV